MFQLSNLVTSRHSKQ